MKLAGAILLAVLTVHDVSYAQIASANKEGAEQAFFAFSSCVVDRRMHAVRQLLDDRSWGDPELKRLRDLAISNPDCGSFEKLGFNNQQFIGALAGALFVKLHRGRPLPDYASVPKLVSEQDIQKASDQETKEALALMAFSECVFRNRPEPVREFLASDPYSKSEQEQLAQLQGVMGACLPAEQGAQLKLGRLGLRGLLAKTAYRIDLIFNELNQAKRLAH